jgi:hypothetical protein
LDWPCRLLAYSVEMLRFEVKHAVA